MLESAVDVGFLGRVSWVRCSPSICSAVSRLDMYHVSRHAQLRGAPEPRRPWPRRSGPTRFEPRARKYIQLPKLVSGHTRVEYIGAEYGRCPTNGSSCAPTARSCQRYGTQPVLREFHPRREFQWSTSWRIDLPYVSPRGKLCTTGRAVTASSTDQAAKLHQTRKRIH